MEDGCWSAPEILAWREPRQTYANTFEGYTGMATIMGNTLKVGTWQARSDPGKIAA